MEITTLSQEPVYASPHRDRTESMPFQAYMNFIWFNGLSEFEKKFFFLLFLKIAALSLN
jgi:hypothetical protein